MISANGNAQLIPADDDMIRLIIHENFSQWSPGLNRSEYYHYQWWQMKQLSWGRKHLRYFALVENNEIVSSCKLYDMEYASRGKTYKAKGIGAVYTPETKRRQGYGRELLRLVEDRCRAEGVSLLALNSDIDPAYYRKAGFEGFPCRNFRGYLSPDWVKKALAELREACPSQGINCSLKIRKLEPTDAPTTLHHYLRWQHSRPLSVVRDNEYWTFKLSRERFLHQYSQLGWPPLELVTLNPDSTYGGYAIFEQGRDIIRVLELVGNRWATAQLWQEVLSLAQRRKINAVTGWESMAPPVSGLVYIDRSWGRSMLKPLCDQVKDWTKLSPCPFLELDHF